MMAAQAILDKCRRESDAGMDGKPLSAGEAETLAECIIELGAQRDRAKHDTLQTLAAAVKKFAPDLAAELAKRWATATKEQDAAFNDLLSALRAE